VPPWFKSATQARKIMEKGDAFATGKMLLCISS